MKRFARAASALALASLLCLVVVTVALNVNRGVLRTAATTQPTRSNAAQFTSKRRTYFGPANLVRRQSALDLSFIILLLVLLLALIVRSAITSIEIRKRQIEMLQKRRNVPAPPDFVIEAGSISWIIPTEAKRAALKSPRGWGPWIVCVVVAWLFFALFHLYPPGLTAIVCAVGIVPAYFLTARGIIGWTSVVTLDDQGINVQLAGKTGRRSTALYRSISGCWIEPSRYVPSLACLTFKFPRRLRSERTVRLELPVGADVGEVVEFLSKKGVVCSDRRIRPGSDPDIDIDS